MIETSNPDIDVDELMERVRAEAAKLVQSGATVGTSRRTLAIALPPVRVLAPPPRLPSFRSVDAKKERIDSILSEAREKSENPNIPKMFRRFFRKQGGYNRLLMDAVARLAKTQVQMMKQLGDVCGALDTQSRWMRALAEHRQSDATWMRAASQQISDLAADVGELGASTEAHSNEASLALDDSAAAAALRAEQDALAEKLRDLQASVEALRNRFSRNDNVNVSASSRADSRGS